MKKKRRLNAWANNPELMHTELKDIKETMLANRSQLAEVVNEEERWMQNVETSRVFLKNHFLATNHEVSRLKSDNDAVSPLNKYKRIIPMQSIHTHQL